MQIVNFLQFITTKNYYVHSKSIKLEKKIKSHFDVGLALNQQFRFAVHDEFLN